MRDSFPQSTGPLPSFDHPLHATASADLPLALHGRGAVLQGGAGAPGLDLPGVVRFDQPPQLAEAEVTGVRLTPLGAERRLRIGGAAVAERICVAHDLPAAVYEWTTDSDAHLTVTWSVARPLAVEWPPSGDDGAGAGAPRPDPTTRVRPGPDARAGDGDAGLVFRFSREPRAWDGEAGGPGRARFELRAGEGVRLAVGGGVGELERIRRRLSAPDELVRARATILEQANGDRLQVLAPEPRVDRGLAWAALVLEACAPEPGIRLWAGLGALALGRVESGRTLLRGTGAATLLAAWTGSSETAAAAARSSPEEPLLLPPECLGDMPGGAAWAEYARDRTASAFRTWLRILLAGPTSRGPWRTAPSPYWAAAVVLPLVHGLLGATPDATLQRLRLRPRIPAEWDRLEVRRLRVADGEVRLRYERRGSRHRFLVSQETGAVPLQLVFEPAVPGTDPRGASVDGREAHLDHRSAGGRTRIGVQLVLDHERTVELDVREPE